MVRHGPKALVVLAALLALNGSQCQIDDWRGPYLSRVTPDAVTITWETPRPSTAVVRYGTGDPLDNEIPVTLPSQHHTMRLTGLLALTGGPGREVLYEVEIDGVTRGGRFSTAVDPTTPFAFIVYGDNRSNDDQHQAVIDAIANEPAPYRFMVSTGDMVSSGQDESNWDDFFAIEGPLLANTPLYTTLGNHEMEGSNWSVTRRIFEMPGQESHYQAVYGNVQIIVINRYVGTLKRIGNIVWGEQERWLRQTLNDPPPQVQHRFLFIHEGPYSSKVGRTGNLSLRMWLDELKAKGVTVVFSGHDHYAERGFADNGLFYAIHGGGGAPLYDTLGPRHTPDHTIIGSRSILGYILVEIDGPLAQIWFKGLEGEVVDYFAYGDPNAPECTAAADCTVLAPPYACVGGHPECYRSACVWSGCPAGLDSLVACVPVIADNCAELLDPTCEGVAECVGTVPYTYCECPDPVPGECDDSLDCAGRPPPIAGCQGTWVCVSQACEFIPDDGICPQPDGPAGGD